MYKHPCFVLFPWLRTCTETLSPTKEKPQYGTSKETVNTHTMHTAINAQGKAFHTWFGLRPTMTKEKVSAKLHFK